MDRLYLRWIAANTWSESAGLGTTLLLGWVIAPHLAGRGPGPIILTGIIAVLLGVLLEGLVVGWAQERVLGGVVPIRRGSWVLATSIGALLAWLVGMVPSTVLALGATSQPNDVIGEPSPGVRFLLAIGLGLVTGPLLGAAQGVVLQRSIPGAWRWLVANAAGWAAGMPVIFAGMDLVPWQGSRGSVAISIYLVTAIAGAVVGTIQGRFLTALVGSARAPAGRPRFDGHPLAPFG
jgi:hypothetical protein